MRVAVISDIHGNYKAFEAFLEYIGRHPVEGIIGLGDYVTDSPYPQRTMELLYGMWEQYPCVLLRGNREEYLLQNGARDQGWRPGASANGALWYTARNLTGRDLEFFAGLPEERSVVFDGKWTEGSRRAESRSGGQRAIWEKCADCYVCHGTPGSVRGNVTLEAGARERALSCISERYLLGGHSHHREVFRWGGKTYLNHGSLGLAVDGVGGAATFAIMTSVSESEWEVEQLAIPYDLESFLKDFAESGLDEAGGILTRAVKKTLLTGYNYFFECVQLAELRGGKRAPAEIPEEIWEGAAAELL